MTQTKAWIQAFRLRTLPLALASVGMGSFLAAFDRLFSWPVMWLSILTTLFLQILSNLANDYGDSIHGADHSGRTGPARAVQSGILSLAAMKKAIILFGALSFFSGLALVSIAVGQSITIFLLFILLGCLAIAAAITYTSGDRPYGYAGLGDIAVLIFFGLLGVAGSYYLHTGSIHLNIWLPALSVGLLSTGVLNVNNIRDIESDKQAGKKSIPVRIGRENAIIYHYFLLILAILAASVFTWLNYRHPVQFIFVLSLPLFWINAKAVKHKSDAKSLDPFLKQLALSTLLFILLFGVGLIISTNLHQL